MIIYIPTSGRPDTQRTLEEVPENRLKDTFLVVYEREKEQYSKYNLIVVPENITKIHEKRQYILDQHDETKYGSKILMLDDDLKFQIRRIDDKEKFREATKEEKEICFDKIENYLEDYAHVGVLGREGGNRVTESSIECTRIQRVLGYRTDILKNNSVRFDLTPFQEDFSVNLQLLTKGYKNIVICDYIQGQQQSGSAGGCSSYRTKEKHGESCKRLQSLFPEFVSVVTKTTKNSFGGGERIDVRVQWKKAYESSKNNSSNLEFKNV